ncbi:MAG: PilZ domain-containing protein [Methylovulum sp.]|nr:PilZ domain-containing protein [Methylovulum sp.]
MSIELQHRDYRKAIRLDGWAYLGGKLCKITVKNISISGAFAVLDPESLGGHQRALKKLSSVKTMDFFLPSLGVSGIAKVIRVAQAEQGGLSFAMAFQDLAHPVDRPFFNRKNYRADIAVPGKLLLNGHYVDFMTVNVSVDGLMVRLPLAFDIEIGMALKFRFPHANRKGLARVMWTRDNDDHETLIGLQLIRRDPLAAKPGQTARRAAVDNNAPARPEAVTQPATPLVFGGISLAASKQGFSEYQLAKLPDVHFEPIDQSANTPVLPARAPAPTPLFCGQNWVSKTSKAPKVRQW